MVCPLCDFLGQMPAQLSQILLDLECGKFSVQVQDQQAPQLRRSLRAIGMDLFWGLVAAGLLAGALPSLLAEPPRTAAWWAVALAGLIAAAVTMRFFLGPFWERLSLRRWLERRWERRRPPGAGPGAG
jgi:ubiquinone biosynthesis protein